MSFDTKYRPRVYADVLGQDANVEILRRYLASGKGLHQSYLFAGGFGSGKTTLGRILARALLCLAPLPNGEPCDQCESCRSLLEHGTSMDFYEIDAATHSGKAEIQKIIEEIQYDTFSGRRRIYLFDESHQLSLQALDALLKPMEDMVAGTLNKRLICIFCTTEPEKMRPTILSRCAPAFIIQPVSPQGVAKRLAYVCQQEGIIYEQDMLVLIAETVECHIRDALKALEGISMLGAVNLENTTKYLKLDLNSLYLDVLEGLGGDLEKSLIAIKQVLEKASPVTCYERLADISILAYQAGLQVGSLPRT